MIYIACDHAALILKLSLIKYLYANGFEIDDLGTHTSKRVDYTVYAKSLCQTLLEGKPSDKGILICGSGIGMSIMANRYHGIRAANCTNEYMARMSIRHNNANVLCLGARVVGDELAVSITKVFLSASFEGGRHISRINHYDNKL